MKQYIIVALCITSALHGVTHIEQSGTNGKRVRFLRKLRALRNSSPNQLRLIKTLSKDEIQPHLQSRTDKQNARLLHYAIDHARPSTLQKIVPHMPLDMRNANQQTALEHALSSRTQAATLILQERAKNIMFKINLFTQHAKSLLQK